MPLRAGFEALFDIERKQNKRQCKANADVLHRCLNARKALGQNADIADKNADKIANQNNADFFNNLEAVIEKNYRSRKSAE